MFFERWIARFGRGVLVVDVAVCGSVCWTFALSPSSSSSLVAVNISLIVFFCVLVWSFAFCLKRPSSDGLASGTTGLVVACFARSSISAFIRSYSARCRCRVNIFAVCSNSSSTIIHSSSRRSNLSTPLRIDLQTVSDCSVDQKRRPTLSVAGAVLRKEGVMKKATVNVGLLLFLCELFAHERLRVRRGHRPTLVML